MKRLLLGFALVAAVVYALRDFFAAPQPHPSWEETDDPEDLSSDLAQRAREAEGAQAAEESETPTG
jgi:hypothetical protein